MRRTLFASLIVLVSLTFAASARSQSPITRIVSIEVNRKEVKEQYRVMLSAGGREVEAKRTPNGFVVPGDFRQERTITARIIFGKYDLVLYDLSISRFSEEWRIGVNKKPFDEQFLVTPEERRNLLFIYYVDFDQTQLFFKVFKKKANTKARLVTSKRSATAICDNYCMPFVLRKIQIGVRPTILRFPDSCG